MIIVPLSILSCSFMVLTPIPERVESRKMEKKKKRTRLYPPSNPYSLVAVAADVRAALTPTVISKTDPITHPENTTSRHHTWLY